MWRPLITPGSFYVSESRSRTHREVVPVRTGGPSNPPGSSRRSIRFGWTLNCRCSFYLLFGLCLFVRWPRLRFGLLAAIFLAAGCGRTDRQPGRTDPSYLHRPDHAGVPCWRGAGSHLTAPDAVRNACGANPAGSGSALGHRGLFAGLPVGAHRVARRPRRHRGRGRADDRAVGALTPSRFGLMLGDASYSIYLAHPFGQRLWLIGVNRTVGLATVSPTLDVRSLRGRDTWRRDLPLADRAAAADCRAKRWDTNPRLTTIVRRARMRHTSRHDRRISPSRCLAKFHRGCGGD